MSRRRGGSPSRPCRWRLPHRGNHERSAFGKCAWHELDSSSPPDPPRIPRRRAWTSLIRRRPRRPRRRCTGRRDPLPGSRSGPGRRRPPPSPPGETRRPRARGRRRRARAAPDIGPRKSPRAAPTRRRSRGTEGHKVSSAGNKRLWGEAVAHIWTNFRPLRVRQ